MRRVVSQHEIDALRGSRRVCNPRGYFRGAANPKHSLPKLLHRAGLQGAAPRGRSDWTSLVLTYNAPEKQRECRHC